MPVGPFTICAGRAGSFFHKSSTRLEDVEEDGAFLSCGRSNFKVSLRWVVII